MIKPSINQLFLLYSEYLIQGSRVHNLLKYKNVAIYDIFILTYAYLIFAGRC